jgi:hypothetical protein
MPKPMGPSQVYWVGQPWVPSSVAAMQALEPRLALVRVWLPDPPLARATPRQRLMMSVVVTRAPTTAACIDTAVMGRQAVGTATAAPRLKGWMDLLRVTTRPLHPLQDMTGRQTAGELVSIPGNRVFGQSQPDMNSS